MTALWAHLEPPPPAVKAPPCPPCPTCRGGWYPAGDDDGLGLRRYRTCECPLGLSEAMAIARFRGSCGGGYA